MKIALISDIHSNLPALNQAIKDAQNQNVDHYIFLGDAISDGYSDNEVIDIISKKSYITVLGNRDRTLLYSKFDPRFLNQKPLCMSQNNLNSDSKSYLEELNNVEFFEYSGLRFLVIHGDQVRELVRPSFIENGYDKLIDMYDFDVCLFGHNHLHSDHTYSGKRFINPGSIGIPADGPEYKYCILTIEDNVFDVALRSFPVDETYLKEFEVSTYYSENPIWGGLIHDSIRIGTSPQHRFFQLLRKNLKDVDATSYTEYNKVWIKTFELYRKEKE